MTEEQQQKRPLFSISVAAELSEMHPQTLRMYERRGLIRPQRTQKQTRLYSMEDVERLRYIQRLTCELGLNLAGVEQLLVMEARVRQLEARVEELQGEVEAALEWAENEVEEVRRSYRKELVPAAGREVMVPPGGRRRVFR